MIELPLGSILLGIALLLVVALILGRPFIVHPDQLVRPAGRQKTLRTLVHEKDEILEAIRDLDFDHDTNKIPTEVYQPQRAHLMAAAARLLKQIDERQSRQAQARPATMQEIETAVAHLRGSRQPSAHPVTNGRTNYCPECGQRVDPEDKFCTACGQPLRTTQPA